MKKDISELINKFKKVRLAFMGEVQQVPENKQESELFDGWSVKDILLHLEGWDIYHLECLTAFREGSEPLWIGYGAEEDAFNAANVKEGRKQDWDTVYSNFVEAGGELINTCWEYPEALWNKRIWEDKEDTPEDLLNASIGHYEEHLKQLKS